MKHKSQTKHATTNNLNQDLNINNDYISMEQDKADRFSISFPRHCVFGHVLSDTNPLNDVDSWKEAVGPSKKPRSVDPRRSNPM